MAGEDVKITLLKRSEYKHTHPMDITQYAAYRFWATKNSTKNYYNKNFAVISKNNISVYHSFLGRCFSGLGDILEYTDGTLGIRPVLQFTKESFPFKNTKVVGYPIVEYGSYPQLDVGDYLDTKTKEKLIPHDKDFKDSETFILEETGKRYVKAYKYGSDYSYTYYDIRPVEWIIDKANNRLISKNIIDAVDMNAFDYSNLKGDMQIWLDEVVLPNLHLEEWTKDGKNKNDNDSKSDKITNILKEINIYLEYYKGKEDIKSKINNLINDYNQELKKNISNSMDINVASDLYKNLIVNLEIELAKLKAYSEDYCEMLNIIKECKNSSIDRNIDPICELIDETKKIAKTVGMEEELLNTINNEEKILNDYLSGNTKLPKMTLDDLKIDFRKRIQDFLLNLRTAAIKKDILEEVRNEIKDNVNNVYNEANNNLIKIYIRTIKELKEEISSKANEKELVKLYNMSKYDINNDDFDSLSKRLKEIVIDLYKLLSDVDSRLFVEKELNKYLIDFNLDTIKDSINTNENKETIIVKKNKHYTYMS